MPPSSPIRPIRRWGSAGFTARWRPGCGAWVLDYEGDVGLGENEDKSSDFVCDFGQRSELALDADSYGNEGRYLNDFRNTGKHANVEFKLRRDALGELRQGIFVCCKSGVVCDEELLVSYGKSYWRSRVGNLTDFVTRLPGQPAPGATAAAAAASAGGAGGGGGSSVHDSATTTEPLAQ